jgi:hypothetical protein
MPLPLLAICAIGAGVGALVSGGLYLATHHNAKTFSWGGLGASVAGGVVAGAAAPVIGAEAGVGWLATHVLVRGALALGVAAAAGGVVTKVIDNVRTGVGWAKGLLTTAATNFVLGGLLSLVGGTLFANATAPEIESVVASGAGALEDKVPDLLKAGATLIEGQIDDRLPQSLQSIVNNAIDKGTGKATTVIDNAIDNLKPKVTDDIDAAQAALRAKMGLPANGGANGTPAATGGASTGSAGAGAGDVATTTTPPANTPSTTPADPVANADPTANANPTASTDPAASTNPTASTDPTASTNPTASTDPTASTNPAANTDAATGAAGNAATNAVKMISPKQVVFVATLRKSLQVSDEQLAQMMKDAATKAGGPVANQLSDLTAAQARYVIGELQAKEVLAHTLHSAGRSGLGLTFGKSILNSFDGDDSSGGSGSTNTAASGTTTSVGAPSTGGDIIVHRVPGSTVTVTVSDAPAATSGINGGVGAAGGSNPPKN